MKTRGRMECLCKHDGIILKVTLKMRDCKSLASSDSGCGRVVGCGGDD